MVLNPSEMANADEETRWLHSDEDLLSGHGVSYNVNVITLFIFLLLIEFIYLLFFI
jgi:hypothetical protein